MTVADSEIRLGEATSCGVIQTFGWGGEFKTFPSSLYHVVGGGIKSIAKLNGGYVRIFLLLDRPMSCDHFIIFPAIATAPY